MTCRPRAWRMAWLLQPAGGDVPSIVGGRTKEQFADNLAAADLKLTEEDIARLDAVSRPDPRLPVLASGHGRRATG